MLEPATVSTVASKGTWDSAQVYDTYMGRWSREIATAFVRWLRLPSGLRWLDAGCGTGALTRSVVQHAMPEAVVALDRSQSFLSFASRELPGERVEWRCGDATKMSFADEGFDVVVSGLVLNFLPSPELMIREMSRVVRRGGTVAAYVWDYGGRMEILRPLLDVAKSMHARAVEADEALRSDNWRPETLARLFASAKLEDITCRGIDLCARFGSFEDYWAPFLGGQGVVGSYILSLTEGERAELRRLLEERMPKEPDGSIALQVRAWGIRGQREGKETA